MDKSYPISERQTEYAYQSDFDALAELIMHTIERGLKQGTWAILDSKPVPIHIAEILQSISKSDTIEELEEMGVL